MTNFYGLAVVLAAVAGGQAARELAPISDYLTDVVAVMFGVVSGAATQVPRFEEKKITRSGLICELLNAGLAGFSAHALLLYVGMGDIRIVWAGSAIAGGLGATATKAIGQQYFPMFYPEEHLPERQQKDGGDK